MLCLSMMFSIFTLNEKSQMHLVIFNLSSKVGHMLSYKIDLCIYLINYKTFACTYFK